MTLFSLANGLEMDLIAFKGCDYVILPLSK